MLSIIDSYMTRTPSQNVVFTGPCVGDDRFDPAGRGIAVGMRDYMRLQGFDVQEEDNWRDCGWSIDVIFPSFVIEVSLTRTTDDNHWIAQITCMKEPGVLSRLFGAKFVSREAEVLSVSRCVHRWLVQSKYEGVLWRIDEFPEPGNGQLEPSQRGQVQS